MRKSYIKRLNNYSTKITMWGLRSRCAESDADMHQRLGHFRRAQSDRAKAEAMLKKEDEFFKKASDLVGKMTQEEYYASDFPSAQCMTYEEAYD
jgi:hypothetical protein